MNPRFSELIPIICQDESYYVNTRALHAFLGIKEPHSRWFHKRAKQWDYIEEIDYLRSIITLKGVQPRIDYVVPINIAKELARMENSPRARQVCRYFKEIAYIYDLADTTRSSLNRLSAMTSRHSEFRDWEPERSSEDDFPSELEGSI